MGVVVNPPNTGSERPPPPQGSGGSKYKHVFWGPGFTDWKIGNIEHDGPDGVYGVGYVPPTWTTMTAPNPWKWPAWLVVAWRYVAWGFRSFVGR